MRDNNWLQLYLAAINAIQTIALAVIAALSHTKRKTLQDLDRELEQAGRNRVDAR